MLMQTGHLCLGRASWPGWLLASQHLGPRAPSCPLRLDWFLRPQPAGGKWDQMAL